MGIRLKQFIKSLVAMVALLVVIAGFALAVTFPVAWAWSIFN